LEVEKKFFSISNSLTLFIFRFTKLKCPVTLGCRHGAGGAFTRRGGQLERVRFQDIGRAGRRQTLAVGLNGATLLGGSFLGKVLERLRTARHYSRRDGSTADAANTCAAAAAAAIIAAIAAAAITTSAEPLQQAGFAAARFTAAATAAADVAAAAATDVATTTAGCIAAVAAGIATFAAVTASSGT